MESNKIQEWKDNFIEKLNEQIWFQELKGKWEELDPQSKTNLKFGGFGLGVLVTLIFTFTFIWNVHSLKKELSEKRALLSTIQNANDEVRRLRENIPNVGLEDRGPWTNYFETLAGTAGFDKSSINISQEKPGASTDQTKESLFDISLKHLNIKQIVRYTFALESGQRPIKLRNLQIDTKNDPNGYLDATLAVSAFSMVKHD